MLRIDRQLLRHLLFGYRRLTQSSPVLPDVWEACALAPDRPLDLLLEPRYDSSPGELAHLLRARLQEQSKRPGRNADSRDVRPRIAYNRSHVVASLHFDALVRCLLPLTAWWRFQVWPRSGAFPGREYAERLFESIRKSAWSEARPTGDPELPADLAWLARIVGTIACARSGKNEEGRAASGLDALEDLLRNPGEIVDGALSLLDGLPEPEDRDAVLFRVHRNRVGMSASLASLTTVKADSARHSFLVRCAGVSWAVLDSGIDARHVAFRRRDTRGRPIESPFVKSRSAGRANWLNHTRIVATYDFTRIRELLSADPESLDELPREMRDQASDLGLLSDLRKALRGGRDIDWELLEPLLRVPHDDRYRPPSSDHGTQVAGIIAADWRSSDGDGTPRGGAVRGICPDLDLHDFRVSDDRGRTDEFSTLCALQLIDHLNGKAQRRIHGANLSLDFPHEPTSFACGQTPICEECERLVAAGTVVVAGGGNSGSITDPGNAEKVITVGATHRHQPDVYGISFFSSHGPTADGRIKPDLVAPGEKVLTLSADGGLSRTDGTSVSAAHVSGAAALLMGWNRGLIGVPEEIKRILCKAATNLGRDATFQGHGLLNVFRALRSTEPADEIEAKASYHIGKLITGDVMQKTTNVNVSGHAKVTNLAVADTIDRSFNRIEGAQASDDLKQQLQDLHKAVAEMTQHLSGDVGERAADDLEVLTKEAVSEKPRRKWYELSGEGLVEAAKSVGEAGVKVIPLVRSIMALLA